MKPHPKVENAYWVLETLREELSGDEAKILNEAHRIIQEYEHELDFEPGETEEGHQ